MAQVIREAWYRLFVDRVAEFAVFVAGRAPNVDLNEHTNAVGGEDNLQESWELSKQREAMQRTAALTGTRFSAD